jgi:hypothetical protein
MFNSVWEFGLSVTTPAGHREPNESKLAGQTVARQGIIETSQPGTSFIPDE